jgi:hypothetical protein
MPSHRDRKREARQRDLSERELELAELLEEVLASVRWLQILGYSNQYLMSHHLKIDREERDKILEAAVRTVDKDQKLHEWNARLARLKGVAVEVHRGINRSKRDMAQGRAPPPSPGLEGSDDGGVR